MESYDLDYVDYRIGNTLYLFFKDRKPKGGYLGFDDYEIIKIPDSKYILVTFVSSFSSREQDRISEYWHSFITKYVSIHTKDIKTGRVFFEDGYTHAILFEKNVIEPVMNNFLNDKHMYQNPDDKDVTFY